MYAYIIPVITLIIFLISFTINRKKEQKFQKYLIYLLVFLQIIYATLTISEKVRSSEKMKEMDTNIFKIMSAITYEKLSKTGYSPKQLDKIFDIKRQLQILAQSFKADSIIQYSYQNYLFQNRVELIIPNGILDTLSFSKALSKAGKFKLTLQDKYFVSPNTIKYCPNIPIHIINFIALACIENRLGINNIEPFPYSDTCTSTIYITYDPKSIFYEKISVNEILSNHSSILHGAKISDYKPIETVSNITIKKINNYYELSWDTPNNGFLSEIHIRYSHYPITIENYRHAYILYDVPQPLPGRRQKVILKGFPKRRDIYYSIVVVDIMSVFSDIAQIHLKQT